MLSSKKIIIIKKEWDEAMALVALVVVVLMVAVIMIHMVAVAMMVAVINKSRDRQ